MQDNETVKTTEVSKCEVMIYLSRNKAYIAAKIGPHVIRIAITNILSYEAYMSWYVSWYTKQVAGYRTVILVMSRAYTSLLSPRLIILESCTKWATWATIILKYCIQYYFSHTLFFFFFFFWIFNFGKLCFFFIFNFGKFCKFFLSKIEYHI